MLISRDWFLLTDTPGWIWSSSCKDHAAYMTRAQAIVYGLLCIVLPMTPSVIRQKSCSWRVGGNAASMLVCSWAPAVDIANSNKLLWVMCSGLVMWTSYLLERELWQQQRAKEGIKNKIQIKLNEAALSRKLHAKQISHFSLLDHIVFI